MSPTNAGLPPASVSAGLAGQEEALLACIHCGFCLPSCPTYRELGDEADSPRGRLHLMRAVGEGRLSAEDESFQLHIDRCLGCRACEPVCPAGVQYGMLLEHAKHDIREVGAGRRVVAGVTAIFGNRILNRIAGVVSRGVRASRVAGLLARFVEPGGALHSVAMAAGMLHSSRGSAADLLPGNKRSGEALRGGDGESAPTAGRVAILKGCVQQELFRRVGDATRFVLETNGYEVVEVPDAGCCGALHAHGGDLAGARSRARDQVEAFESRQVDWVVTDAAGCGAAMKEYGHLLSADTRYADRAASVSGKVRDICELLASTELVRGAEVPLRVTYDPPCHLIHAQQIRGAVETVLGAVPGLELLPLEQAEMCCGGAGVYGLTHADLGKAIGDRKVAAVMATGADAVLTGNPGCMMQIGAGLQLEKSPIQVLHPVEILAESYRRLR